MSMSRISVYSVKLVRESAKLYNVSRTVSTPQAAYNAIEAVLNLQEAAEERFGILSLSAKNEVIGINVLAVGSLTACIVHPREVFKAAMLNNACSIVAFHNHPSGNPTPSPEDIQLTKRLTEAGELLDIKCLDHIIVGHGRFISLNEVS